MKLYPYGYFDTLAGHIIDWIGLFLYYRLSFPLFTDLPKGLLNYILDFQPN